MLPWQFRCALLIACSALATSGFAEESSPSIAEIGQAATDFTLPIVGGDGEIQLSQLYKDGPVVVLVLRGYPGYQCPLCTRQVGDFVKHADLFKQATAKVVMIYPGAPTALEAHAEEFLGDQLLPDPLVLVRDASMNMVTNWGLRWDAPRETAYPSTFIVDSQGKVAWKQVSKTHGGRASAKEVLKQLQAL